MEQKSTGRAVAVGLAIAFGATLGWRVAQKAPEIAVAWGNAFAERERRGAAEDARRAEAEKASEAQRIANEDYNEAHCKVTIEEPTFFPNEWKTQVVTNVRGIRPGLSDKNYAYIRFGGGVERWVRVVKTEDCR